MVGMRCHRVLSLTRVLITSILVTLVSLSVLFCRLEQQAIPHIKHKTLFQSQQKRNVKNQHGTQHGKSTSEQNRTVNRPSEQGSYVENISENDHILKSAADQAGISNGTNTVMKSHNFDAVLVAQELSNGVKVHDQNGGTGQQGSREVHQFEAMNNTNVKVSNYSRTEYFKHKDFWDVKTEYNFTYTIQPNGLCANNRVRLVFVVLSAPNNTELRAKFRQVMVENAQGIPIEIMFMLGQPEDHETQDIIISEAGVHNDILQVNYKDSYRTLTYKMLSGLKWISKNCPNNTFMYKLDDSSMPEHYLRLDRIISVLSDPVRTALAQPDILCGETYMNGKPRRDLTYKYHLTVEEDPEDKHPLLCLGSRGYMMSSTMAGRLYEEAQHTHFIWLEDVFITGILRQRIKAGLRDLPLTSRDYKLMFRGR